ncbi:MAG: sigma-70 family RNA polymerase sigma factor [Chitinivibrionales bacterium]|nr:sigma-70 family RNA polymerase sigma factor [Chitinivibrionales bacterium]
MSHTISIPHNIRVKPTSLEQYLKEISKSKSLSREDEFQLARRIKKGDKSALKELVECNLRFVVGVARTYQNQGLPLNDLINEGNLGLIKAAKRFDENKNFKFISYAVWWIRQSILQALANQSRITKLPLNQVGTIHKIGKAQSKLEQRKSRTPDIEEIADDLDLDKDRVIDAVRIGNNHASLDAPLAQGKDLKLLDILTNSTISSPDSNVNSVSLRQKIYNVLSSLCDKEKEILILYFGINDGVPLTLDEISQRFDITRERVRQLKQRAIQKLKDSPETQLLRAYH